MSQYTLDFPQHKNGHGRPHELKHASVIPCGGALFSNMAGQVWRYTDD
jgi:hypothetical protein